MPIMLYSLGRCLWVATMTLLQFEGAAHVCCSLDADLQTRLGVAEPRSSLTGEATNKGQRDGSEAHLRQGLTAGDVTDFWGGNCGFGRGGIGRGGGRWVVDQGGEHAASSVVEISTWHQTRRHIKKKTHAPSLRLTLYLPTPFSSLCYQGEGLMSPTPARRGWCKKLSSLPSLPLVMGLAREEREARAVQGERRVNPPCSRFTLRH